MRTTNCLESRFSSRSKSVRLFVAFAFGATSLFALGCKTTDGKTCCGFGSNNPEKLATVNAPDSLSSDSVSRGQTNAALDSSTPSEITPSEISKERLDKTFSSVQPDVPQATGAESENRGDAGSFAANDSSSTSPKTESLGSLNYVPTTNNPTSESNIPNVTPAPSASIQPPTEIRDAANASANIANASENFATQEPGTAREYLSVAPSAVQESANAIAEHTAKSVDEARSDLESKLEEIDQKASDDVNATLTPLVEKADAVASTFANEENQTENLTSPSISNADSNAPSSEQKDKETVKETATEVASEAAKETTTETAPETSNETPNLPTPSEASPAPETKPIVNPTLDTSVPVTFKPTAASRVVEIQTTGATEVLNSRVGSVQRSARRVPSKVGLITAGTATGKPIDASKDASRLTRIRPRR